MTNAKQLENSSEYVEVNLSIDLTYYRPTTSKDGKLTFVAYTPDEAYNCFKCMVPKEAVTSKEALTEYVSDAMIGCDIIDLNKVNIWDVDGLKGDFRFPY